jgi:hypothetical protein
LPVLRCPQIAVLQLSTEVEERDEINRFKTDSEYADDLEVASMHRVRLNASRGSEQYHATNSRITCS